MISSTRVSVTSNLRSLKFVNLLMFKRVSSLEKILQPTPGLEKPLERLGLSNITQPAYYVVFLRQTNPCSERPAHRTNRRSSSFAGSLIISRRSGVLPRPRCTRRLCPENPGTHRFLPRTDAPFRLSATRGAPALQPCHR